MTGTILRRRSRSLLWATTLALVLARGLVPAGLMLGPDDAGQLALVICPGTAQVAPPGDAPFHHHPAQDRDAARWHGSCAFAVSALAAPPPQSFAPVPEFLHPAGVAPVPAVPSATIPTILRTQSSRAPPVPA